VAEKAGTYLPAEDATVTHLEVLEALRHEKTVIVYVKDAVLSTYFSSMKGQIEEGIRTYIENNGKNPLSIYQEIIQMVQLPPGYDPYTWVLVHDLVEREIYLEQLHLGVDIKDKISTYLSKLLRDGVSLIPYKSQFAQNALHVKVFEEYKDLSKVVMSKMTSAHLSNKDWTSILTVLREKVKGGEIVRQIGEYRKQTLGRYRDCSAISLYLRNGDMMERIAADGRVGGGEFYHLETDRDSSFVVQTYLANQSGQVYLWYREKKRTVYLTFREGEFVLCLHFVLEQERGKSEVERYQQDYIRGILEEQGNFQFIELVMGGMKNAKIS
ncbi:MAG: hypothetical protein ACXVOI_07290, partial [Tumebacillaceae bacterium]